MAGRGCNRDVAIVGAARGWYDVLAGRRRVADLAVFSGAYPSRCVVFEKLAVVPSVSRSSSLPSLTVTSEFLSCVKAQGFRLSYGALALAARTLISAEAVVEAIKIWRKNKK
jgi:hypothetical protein